VEPSTPSLFDYSASDMQFLRRWGELQHLFGVLDEILLQSPETAGTSFTKIYRRWILTAALRAVVVELSACKARDRCNATAMHPRVPWQDIEAMAKRLRLAPRSYPMMKSWHRILASLGRRIANAR
jgi:hypothetical protein